MFSIMMWATMPAQAGSAMKAALKWEKKHEHVLALGSTNSDGFYWRYKNRKDRTIYFSDRTGKRAVTTATDYVAVEGIPASYGLHGAWGQRTQDRACRARTGLTKGMGARHEEGLDCSMDWIATDGTVIQRFDHLEGIWLNFGNMEVVNGTDVIHPAVVSMVQRQGEELWFQFVNVETREMTTPWLPEIVFIGDKSWETATIPLPSGEFWPIGDDGNRVGERRSIAGYTPIFENDGGLFGWVVRHDTGEGEALLGIADRHGTEIVAPTLASFELQQDGWCVVTDPQGRFRSHPLAFLDDVVLWDDTLEGARGRGRAAVAAEAARIQAIEQEEAAARAELAAAIASWRAEEAQRNLETQRMIEKHSRAEEEQQQWCERVVDDCRQRRELSLSDLDDAVRLCDERLEGEARSVLYAAKHEALNLPVRKPRRFSFAQMVIAAGNQPPQAYRSGTAAYSGSSDSLSSSDLEAIRDRAAVERSDARFEQFIDYISGSSTYDPSPVYRYNR